jgi:hypothetical protein
MSAPSAEGRAARQEMAPAHGQPCKHCPWRLSNQGKRHQHGFYTKANLRRLWNGLRRGERMTCHPTDPAMAEFEGYEGTAERHVTHECAGAQILVQREIDRAQRCIPEGGGDGYRPYRAKHPMGLLRGGLLEHISTHIFAGTFLGGLRPTKVNLNEKDVGYEPLGTWEARR